MFPVYQQSAKCTGRQGFCFGGQRTLSNIISAPAPILTLCRPFLSKRKAGVQIVVPGPVADGLPAHDSVARARCGSGRLVEGYRYKLHVVGVDPDWHVAFLVGTGLQVPGWPALMRLFMVNSPFSNDFGVDRFGVRRCNAMFLAAERAPGISAWGVHRCPVQSSLRPRPRYRAWCSRSLA